MAKSHGLLAPPYRVESQLFLHLLDCPNAAVQRRYITQLRRRQDSALYAAAARLSLHSGCAGGHTVYNGQPANENAFAEQIKGS